MPGNSEKRPGYVRATRPPTYVNVPAAVAYAPVPDSLVVTMLRILGLCWTNRYRRSPPLTTEELVRLLDRPRTTLQRHLDLLECELGWLRRERRDGRFILHPCPPFSAQPVSEDLDPSPGASVAIEALGPAESKSSRASVSGEPPSNDHARTPSASVPGEPQRPGQNGSGPSAPAPYDGRRHWSDILAEKQDLLQALADVGIENPARERIALESVVEVDWIAAWQLWAEHPHRASLSNLPGFIVKRLKHRERPPEQYLRLVRLTPAEKAELEYSRWGRDRDLDPDLRAIRSLYLHHFPLRP